MKIICRPWSITVQLQIPSSERCNAGPRITKEAEIRSCSHRNKDYQRLQKILWSYLFSDSSDRRETYDIVARNACFFFYLCDPNQLTLMFIVLTRRDMCLGHRHLHGNRLIIFIRLVSDFIRRLKELLRVVILMNMILSDMESSFSSVLPADPEASTKSYQPKDN